MSLTFGILHLLLVAASAVAHCQLAWPYPLHSPLNPANPNSIKGESFPRKKNQGRADLLHRLLDDESFSYGRYLSLQGKLEEINYG